MVSDVRDRRRLRSETRHRIRYTEVQALAAEVGNCGA
jgi:hypothetical protein